MRANPTADQSIRSSVNRPIRVALVDDQALVRSGFRMMVDAEEGIEVVGEAGDGEAAIELIRTTPMDIMLMDVRMPGIDGIETTRRIIEAGYPVKIIILTTFDLDDYVYEALRAGASGFLLKDARATELVDAIHAVNSGDAIIAPSTTKRLLNQLLPAPPARAPQDPRRGLLTDRETDVLKQIAQGWNNTEIADNLHMAESTVKAHISRLLAKLQARDRVGLVLAAHDMGLMPQTPDAAV